MMIQIEILKCQHIKNTCLSFDKGLFKDQAPATVYAGFHSATWNLNLGAPVRQEKRRILALIPQIFFIVLLNFFDCAFIFQLRHTCALSKKGQCRALHISINIPTDLVGVVWFIFIIYLYKNVGLFYGRYCFLSIVLFLTR
jgi:hypothetical protein